MSAHDDMLGAARDMFAATMGRQGASITYTDSDGNATALTDATTSWMPGNKYVDEQDRKKLDVETAQIMCAASEVAGLDTRGYFTRSDDSAPWTISGWEQHGDQTITVEVQKVTPREVSSGRNDFHGPQRYRGRR